MVYNLVMHHHRQLHDGRLGNKYTNSSIHPKCNIDWCKNNFRVGRTFFCVWDKNRIESRVVSRCLSKISEPQKKISESLTYNIKVLDYTWTLTITQTITSLKKQKTAFVHCSHLNWQTVHNWILCQLGTVRCEFEKSFLFWYLILDIKGNYS